MGPTWRVSVVSVAATLLCAVTAGDASAVPGALDPSFDHRGMVAEPLGHWAVGNAAAVQRNGDIVTSGEERLAGGRPAIVSTRLLPNGRLDPSYGRDGVVTVALGSSSGGTSVAILSNGDILLAGAGRLGHAPLGFAAVELLPDGRRNRSFGKDGVAEVAIGSEAIAWSVAVQRDGKIVLGGQAEETYPRIAAARLTPSGSLDTSFGRGGVQVLSAHAVAWSMALAPGGDVVLGGEVNPEPQPGLLGTLVGILSHNLGLGQEYMAARLSPDGTPDRSFGSDGVVTVPVGVKSVANGVAVEPNGDVVLGGSGFIGKNVVSATARLLPGGGLDPKFGTGGESIQVLAHGINAIATQPDGKLVLAGTGPTAIRLNADGSPDGTFGADGIDWIGNRAGNGANGVTFDRANGDIVLTGGATLSGRVELSVIRLHGT